MNHEIMHMKQKKKTTPLREWCNALLFAIIVASLIRWLAIEHFVIPSSSMEQTLLTGDHILVSKLHYGARTPQTPLQLPLTHQTLGSTGIPAYLDWIRLPQYRLPGCSSVQRGDQVVFNYPMELDKPVDLRAYWIKRCVGLPGDVLHIRDAQVYINEAPQPQYAGLQYRYFLKTEATLSGRFFSQYAIREHAPVQGGHLAHTPPATAAQLAALPAVQKVKRLVMPPSMADPQVYPSSEALPWNADHLGPITVPARGMRVPINAATLAQYERAITYHEGHRDVQIEDAQLWIDGQQVEAYTFRQDYYYMMGDNRHNSLDSRFWGFVPQDHLVGKAVLILFSLDPARQFISKLRWARFFRLVGCTKELTSRPAYRPGKLGRKVRATQSTLLPNGKAPGHAAR